MLHCRVARDRSAPQRGANDAFCSEMQQQRTVADEMSRAERAGSADCTRARETTTPQNEQEACSDAAPLEQARPHSSILTSQSLAQPHCSPTRSTYEHSGSDTTLLSR